MLCLLLLSLLTFQSWSTQGIYPYFLPLRSMKLPFIIQHHTCTDVTVPQLIQDFTNNNLEFQWSIWVTSDMNKVIHLCHTLHLKSSKTPNSQWAILYFSMKRPLKDRKFLKLLLWRTAYERLIKYKNIKSKPKLSFPSLKGEPQPGHPPHPLSFYFFPIHMNFLPLNNECPHTSQPKNNISLLFHWYIGKKYRWAQMSPQFTVSQSQVELSARMHFYLKALGKNSFPSPFSLLAKFSFLNLEKSGPHLVAGFCCLGAVFNF